MGLAEQIKQDPQQYQSTTSTSELLARVDALEKYLQRQTEYLKAQTQEQSRIRDLVSTTQRCDCTPSATESVSNRLSEIEKTLSVLSATQTVLSRSVDGEKLTAAAQSMTQAASTMTSQAAANQKAMSSLVADREQVSRAATRSIQLVQDAAVKQIEQAAGETSTAATSRLDEVVERAERLTATADRLSRSLSVWGVARVCLALVPIAMCLLALATLTGAVGWALGLGPLYSWAWSSFEAASVWWQKALIAAATVGTVLALIAAALWVGSKLRDTYRGWR